MKTTHLCFLLLGLCVTSFGFANDKAPAEDRETLAKRAKAQRLAYAASPEYNPYDTSGREALQSAYALLDKKKYGEAIATAQKGLAKAKYDIELLIVLTAAYRESGNISDADKTSKEWVALVDSILLETTGHDFASAYQVISVAEEYAVIHVLRFKVVSQSLVGHEGSEFDLITVKNPSTNSDTVFYFNIDLPKKWLTREFSGLKH